MFFLALEILIFKDIFKRKKFLKLISLYIPKNKIKNKNQESEMPARSLYLLKVNKNLCISMSFGKIMATLLCIFRRRFIKIYLTF